MQIIQRSQAIEPMMEMNTTPLIDVMLVLLIMFIITIPMQSHAVKLDLPTGGPITADPLKNKVVVTASGQILWNAAPVSLAGLRDNLAATQQLAEEPELQLQPEPEARYALVDQVLAETKRAQVARLGFVGNERFGSF